MPWQIARFSRSFGQGATTWTDGYLQHHAIRFDTSLTRDAFMGVQMVGAMTGGMGLFW
jgi:hypothetical protein